MRSQIDDFNNFITAWNYWTFDLMFKKILKLPEVDIEEEVCKNIETEADTLEMCNKRLLGCFNNQAMTKERLLWRISVLQIKVLEIFHTKKNLVVSREDDHMMSWIWFKTLFSMLNQVTGNTCSLESYRLLEEEICSLRKKNKELACEKVTIEIELGNWKEKCGKLIAR